jgi:dynein heavy chain
MVRDAARRLEIRMPALFDLRTAHPDSFKQSLGIFLGQELLRFNGLIEVMLSTLMELQRAIKGEVVMSVELETMYNCFVFQKVPPIWERVGYPCLKPLTAWIEDFILRIAFMGDWLHLGPCPCYWLPGFFFPQGFMTAVKQVYSRDHCIAVDTLTMGCEITGMDASNVVSIPSSGAYIYGLFMEGGRFNRGSCTMSDSRPRELYDQMPCIWLKPMLLSEYVANEGFYKCPVYKTSIRAGTLSTTGHSTNFVVALPVPSTVHEDHWIRRGCALLCMLDD